MSDTKLDRAYHATKKLVAGLRASNEEYAARTGSTSSVSETDYEALELKEMLIFCRSALGVRA